MKILWKDFKKDFEYTLSTFRNHVENVEKEVGISNMIEGSNEWALVRAEREENERQRKSSPSISKRRMGRYS